MAKSRERLPKLIVFDLDYTLWPFWVDCERPPFSQVLGTSTVIDRFGKPLSTYIEVPQMLSRLQECKVALAVASRTSEIEDARHLLRLFNWNQFFLYKQIYPGAKTSHLKKIMQSSGVPAKDIIFFDDEERNITDVSALGITCILVKGGMNNSILSSGLREWASKNA